MANKFKSPEEAAKHLGEAIDEVEKLMKSWGAMAKAEGEEQPEGEMPPESAAPAEGAPEGAPEGAAEGEVPAEEVGEQSEMPNEEAGEGHSPEEEKAAMSQHAAELSDEELHMMLDILHEELEKRSASQEGQEGAPAAPAEDKNLAMSMKNEFAKLSKSFNSKIETLEKSVNSLKTENASLKKKMSMPVTKPASANARAVEKTVSTPEPLNKSQTIEFLEGELRGGNRRVNGDLVATVCAVKSDEDLQEAHRRIKNAGIKLPNS